MVLNHMDKMGWRDISFEDSLASSEDVWRMKRTPVESARTTILAAKYAYAQGSEKWLGLLSRAVTLIEACPEHIQECLLSSLESLPR